MSTYTTVDLPTNGILEYRVISWDRKNPAEFETEWFTDSFHVAQRTKKLRNSGKVYRVTEHVSIH